MKVDRPDLTPGQLLSTAREEVEALALMSYHGDPSVPGVWKADINKDYVADLRDLILALTEELEAARPEIANLREMLRLAGQETDEHAGRVRELVSNGLGAQEETTMSDVALELCGHKSPFGEPSEPCPKQRGHEDGHVFWTQTFRRKRGRNSVWIVDARGATMLHATFDGPATAEQIGALVAVMELVKKKQKGAAP